ncbi:MAG: OsmC family protein [Chitinophagales bacterium]
MTSTVVYQGSLRTHCVHLKSGKVIITDAPTDNHGKGEAFSPTDLVATGLASCMISMMGIKANQHNIDIEGAKANVTKMMQSNPRRIAAIKVIIEMPAIDYTEKERKLLEHTAKTCPVAYSLHPNVVQELSFEYQTAK